MLIMVYSGESFEARVFLQSLFCLVKLRWAPIVGDAILWNLGMAVFG